MFLLFTCLFNLNGFSQALWPQAGANWHYGIEYFALYTPKGFHHYWYSNDTLVSGKVFAKIKGEQQLYLDSAGGVIQDTVATVPRFVHYSNDTVYLLDSNQLQFLWYNGAVPGDIWDFGIHYDDWTGQFIHAYSQVDSVKYVIINGDSIKEIYSHSAKDSMGTMVQPGDTAFIIPWIEQINVKFGPMRGFNLIGTFHSPIVFDAFTSDEFLCYSSDSFPMYQAKPDVDCNNNIFSSVGPDLYERGLLNVHPNPASDFIFIESPLLKNGVILVSNILGQTVYTCPGNGFNRLSLYVGKLPEGSYFISVTDGEYSRTGRFIKQ